MRCCPIVPPCAALPPAPPPITPATHAVRLVGRSPEETLAGRVEVLNQGTYGTVCMHGFDVGDAQVVSMYVIYNGTVMLGQLR